MPRDTVTIRRGRGYFVPAPGPPAGYVGPGDIITGWKAWYGMRAFSATAAAAGINAVQILFTGGTTQTYKTATNGNYPDGTAGGTIDFNTGFDSGGSPSGSSYTAYLAAHPGTVAVARWYDQSGNGFDVAPAGAAPAFTVNSINKYPGITTVGTADMLASGGGITQTQPLSISVVAEITSTAAGSRFLTDSTDSLQVSTFNVPPMEWYGYAGGAAGEGLDVPNNIFHAAQFIIQGGAGNSITYVDGVPSPGTSDVGTAFINATTFSVCGTNSVSLIGVSMEMGLYNGRFDSVGVNTIKAALNANQHSVYDF